MAEVLMNRYKPRHINTRGLMVITNPSRAAISPKMTQITPIMTLIVDIVGFILIDFRLFEIL